VDSTLPGIVDEGRRVLTHAEEGGVTLRLLGGVAVVLRVDAKAGDVSAVNGDFFSLDYIRDRIQHTFTEADRTRINVALEELNGVVGDEDLEAAADVARTLRQTLAGLLPSGDGR
jgi:hypothetical protein